MKLPAYSARLLMGVLCGALVGLLMLVPRVSATECVPQDEVKLTFESATSAADAAFWQREFTPLDDPHLYDRRALTNVSLSSHDGWWRLKHKGAR